MSAAILKSTLLQELEWHLHTALFALVLGFGTIYNTHVRVDLVRDHLSFRKKVWIEFLGLTCFMIPYLLLVIYFAANWVVGSYNVGEISASTVGLSHRWIIKAVLVAGLCVATIAGIAVWLQVAFLLRGETKRFKLMTLEWPEEAGTRIEGKERIVLDETPGVQPPSLVSEAPGMRPKPAEQLPGGGDCQRGRKGRHFVGRGCESEECMQLDWGNLFKRYVGDDTKTPYLVGVERLTRVQANYELFVYTLFLTVLFGVIGVASLSPNLPHGHSISVSVYAFIVASAAVVFGFTEAPGRAPPSVPVRRRSIDLLFGVRISSQRGDGGQDPPGDHRDALASL